MPTIRDTLSQSIAKLVPPSALKSILGTLNESAGREIGSLDLAATRDLLGQVAIGVKLFGGRLSPSSLDAVRQGITGGKAPAPTRDVIRVASDQDVLYVQRRTQMMTKGFFNGTDCVRLATAASELARNIYMYARTGCLTLTLAEENRVVSFTLLAEDQGPGIANLDEVFSGHYVSRTGLGKGLRGTRALLDGLEVQSVPGRGTTIHGWKKARRG